MKQEIPIEPQLCHSQLSLLSQVPLLVSVSLNHNTRTASLVWMSSSEAALLLTHLLHQLIDPCVSMTMEPWKHEVSVHEEFLGVNVSA